jgi:hypothetical protein
MVTNAMKILGPLMSFAKARSKIYENYIQQKPSDNQTWQLNPIVDDDFPIENPISHF